MLGAGAGLVIVPVLLMNNVHPRVAAATSGTMYFFISATSILTVITQQLLSTESLLWYMCLGFIGGKKITIKKYSFFLRNKIYL
jgi:uncharacterized membrane protein YfcA